MSDKPQPHWSRGGLLIPRGEQTPPGEAYSVFDGEQPGQIFVSGPGIHEQQPFFAASIRSLINRVYDEGYQRGLGRGQAESHEAFASVTGEHVHLRRINAEVEQVIRLASEELKGALVGQDREVALSAFEKLRKAIEREP